MLKKKIGFLVAGIVFAATMVLSVGTATSNQESNFKLDQLVQQAEACAEVGGMGYNCCPDNSWCYIGGGYEMYPFWYD